MSTEALIMTLESPDPAKQAEVNDALDLALAANDAFDQRLVAAQLLAAAMRSNGGVIGSQRLGEYSEADATFLTLVSAATTLMPPGAVPPGAASETAEADQEAEESLASPEVWAAMSREQRAFTLEARTALAAGKLNEHGVTEKSLRVMMTEVDGKNKFTLVHTGNGVDIGNPTKDYDPARSYPKVMSRKNDRLFKVKVGGATYDSRAGMTDEVYDAKVQDARDRDVILPDSQQLAEDAKDVWTWTMLTGDGLTADGYVQIRLVADGEVLRSVFGPDFDRRNLRVCPAVEIPDFSS